MPLGTLSSLADRDDGVAEAIRIYTRKGHERVSV